MTDYFSYNGEDVVPTYMPGISSYGQEGSEGNTGDIGSSVYYTTYDLSDDDDLYQCNERIKRNMVLSDTDYSPLYNKEYMVGDIVIDALGNIFVIEEGSESLVIVTDSTSSEDSPVKEMFKDFKVKVITSFLRNPEYPGYIENPTPVTLDAIKNYTPSGNDEMREKIFGNWLSFSITPVAKADSYLYTFCLVLPTKEVLSMTSAKPFAKMFIDNRYLTSSDYYENIFIPDIASDSLDPKSAASIMFGSDVRKKIGHSSAQDFIDKSIFTYDNWKFDEYDEEQAKYATMILSYYIHCMCSAYVEIKNTITGKIYRYDLKDVEGNADLPTALQDNNFIIPYVEPGDWENLVDSSYQNTLVDFEITDSSIVRSFKNFIVADSIKIDVSEEIGSSEYEYIQHFYFTDVKGINFRDGEDSGERDDDVDIDHQTPINYWKKVAGIDNYSNTLLLEFGDIDSLCLNIDFSKWENSDKEFPATAVYISYPNVHLWQEGDENGNVILPNSINEDKTDSFGNPIYDGKQGYYYLYKILPPGYSTEYESAEAGRSSIIFDLTQFKLNEKHNWIEIGLMMIEDIDGEINNLAHRSTIKSLNPDFNYYNEDGTLKDLAVLTFEELANGNMPRDNRDYDNINQFCVPFVMGHKKEGEGEDAVITDVFMGGEPEVTLFINNIVPHSDDATNESDEEEIVVELQEDSTKINYLSSGIHYDEPTYNRKITIDTYEEEGN